MKVCIVGSSGLIGRNICNNLLKNHFKVIGISRKNSEVSKNFKHIKLDIENDELTYNIIKIVNESDVIIFCLNKKERPKNLEYDINKLIFYHVFFPLRLLKKLSLKKRKIIIINSDAIISKKSNFHYTLTKMISSTLVKFSKELINDKNQITSLILGRFKDKNTSKKNQLFELINLIIKTKTNLYTGKNILVYSNENLIM
tara:strand:- start:571 stop:1170 length:600 start_codon:yes stop_codon:yes gene_type:complete